MQLTESFYLTDQSECFEEIKNWSLISKDLYNQALYIIKKHNEHQKDNDLKTYLNYSNLDKIMKNVTNQEGEINYKLMPLASVAQQCLILLDRNIRSFYQSIKDWKKHPEKYKRKPEFPKFLAKNKRFQLDFTSQRTYIKNGYLKLTKTCRIELPKFISVNNFDHIRIIPVTRKRFKIEIIYTIQEKELKQNNKRYLGIDLGVNNFATIVTNCKLRPMIFNGKELKSYNIFYNKRKAFLQSKLAKNQYTSKQLEELEFKRYCKIQDMFHLYSARIIQYCLKNEINTIVIGRNKGWKQNCNMGVINNQKFVQIPYLRFIKQLEYKCKLYGINFIETEESYTSKIDHLANEPICHQESYSGKRLKRGLFQSVTNKIINADVNGSIGILRKKNVVFDSNKIEDNGLLFRPIRLKCYRIKSYILFDNLVL